MENKITNGKWNAEKVFLSQNPFRKGFCIFLNVGGKRSLLLTYSTLSRGHNDAYFFPILRAGGMLQILQSDWFRERAVFYDLAC